MNQNLIELLTKNQEFNDVTRDQLRVWGAALFTLSSMEYQPIDGICFVEIVCAFYSIQPHIARLRAILQGRERIEPEAIDNPLENEQQIAAE